MTISAIGSQYCNGIGGRFEIIEALFLLASIAVIKEGFLAPPAYGGVGLTALSDNCADRGRAPRGAPLGRAARLGPSLRSG